MDTNLVVGIALYAIAYILVLRTMQRPGPISIAIATQQLEAGEQMQRLLAELTSPVHVESQRSGKRYKGA